MSASEGNLALAASIERQLAEAEMRAWDSLARYKFMMFGYYAARCVVLKRLLGRGREPFFVELVQRARAVMVNRYGSTNPMWRRGVGPSLSDLDHALEEFP